MHVEEGEWHILVENSKTGKPHIVYLSTQAQTLFKELKPLTSGSDWVLPGRGTLATPFASNVLNQALKVSLQEEDIPAFTIHDLRRTASTLLHKQGWPSDVVEKALNHTIGGVLGAYNRTKCAEQRREMPFPFGYRSTAICARDTFIDDDYHALIQLLNRHVMDHTIMKRCIVGVRQPDGPTSKGSETPSIWFPSLASLAAVLSDDNRRLLRLIHDRQPKSLTELAELSGRKVPNLSRTLRLMAGYGLVSLQRNVRDVQPTALATEFLVVLD